MTVKQVLEVYEVIEIKVFGRVWYAGLWQFRRSLKIEEGLVQAIQLL